MVLAAGGFARDDAFGAREELETQRRGGRRGVRGEENAGSRDALEDALARDHAFQESGGR